MKKTWKTLILGCCLLVTAATSAGCAGGDAKQSASAKTPDKDVVIYTNADKEAVKTMEDSLNSAGFSGKYVLKTMGTSELGGKLLVEGSKIEADLITMSSYFIESAQQKNQMFAPLTVSTKQLAKTPDYYAPILANTGAIFVNTQVIKEKNLPLPKSIKDLTQPEYKNLVSIPNIMNSSTAWLLVQAVLAQYAQQEGQAVLAALAKNCGPHIETSGSGPIKKVRAGEVAAGFGLRHQAVADKESGKPIDFIDPLEGNYSLIEGLAVIKKGTAANPLAMEMAKTIIEKGRPELIKYYPVALYQGEAVTAINKPANPKTFAQPLTVELLAQHQKFFQAAQQQ